MYTGGDNGPLLNALPSDRQALYNHHREIMLQEVGSQYMTTEEILSIDKQLNDLKNVTDILGKYISDSGRFM